MLLLTLCYATDYATNSSLLIFHSVDLLAMYTTLLAALAANRLVAIIVITMITI